MICWNCREAVAGAVCVGCSQLQPPPPKPDLFEVLGVQRRFHVDPKAIDAAWKERSRLTHPDRFTKSGALQRRLALQWTATLNEARLVLKDPVSRAWYLVTGQGRPPEGNTLKDQDFLEIIFDLRMAADDAPDEVRARTEELKLQLDGALDERFTAWEEGKEGLDSIPDLLARLRYVDNLLQELPAA